jgi:hypothetical protein
MFLYDKMQTFQMKKNDNITKHMHTLKSLLEQLFATRTLILNDVVVVPFIRNTLPL